MRDKSSAIGRVAIAIHNAWREILYTEELLLRRPWDDEGNLRWQRTPTGRKLNGRWMP